MFYCIAVTLEHSIHRRAIEAVWKRLPRWSPAFNSSSPSVISATSSRFLSTSEDDDYEVCCYCQRITEWFGLEATQERWSCSKPSAVGRDTFHQTSCWNPPSVWPWTLGMGHPHLFWATCSSLQSPFILTVKNFCLISNINLLSFMLKPLLLVLSLHAVLFLLSCSPLGTEGCSKVSGAFSSPVWAIPALSACVHKERCSRPLIIIVALL